MATSGVPVVATSGDTLLLHGRVPMTVYADPRLKHVDVRVFAAIAQPAFEGSVTRIGIRRLAELCCCSRKAIAASVKRLASHGHLKVVEGVRGARATYSLTSPVFGQKQGHVNVVRSTPRGKRLVSVEKIA